MYCISPEWGLTVGRTVFLFFPNSLSCMDADTNITVGQWTKSEPWHMTNHAVSQSDKMASRMCAAALASDHGVSTVS